MGCSDCSDKCHIANLNCTKTCNITCFDESIYQIHTFMYLQKSYYFPYTFHSIVSYIDIVVDRLS